jgi:hypothetical protein
MIGGDCMSAFPGGSAWAMAKDISEGHILVTERVVRRLNVAEMGQLSHELDRKLRELRGEQPDLEDSQALQARNRRIQRLRNALQLVHSVRTRPTS